MMDAVDEYQVLNPTLPRRLSGLNKVGFRESGGMVVGMFTYDGVRSLLRVLSTWLFGTGPQTQHTPDNRGVVRRTNRRFIEGPLQIAGSIIIFLAILFLPGSRAPSWRPRPLACFDPGRHLEPDAAEPAE